MDLFQFSGSGLTSRLLAALVAFALLAAAAAVSIMVAMMAVLFSAERLQPVRLSRFGATATHATLVALTFGVLCPPLLLVSGVPAVYCWLCAALGFAFAGVGAVMVLCSMKNPVEESRRG